jgi:hypothetical protein
VRAGLVAALVRPRGTASLRGGRGAVRVGRAVQPGRPRGDGGRTARRRVSYRRTRGRCRRRKTPAS